MIFRLAWAVWLIAGAIALFSQLTHRTEVAARVEGAHPPLALAATAPPIPTGAGLEAKASYTPSNTAPVAALAPITK